MRPTVAADQSSSAVDLIGAEAGSSLGGSGSSGTNISSRGEGICVLGNQSTTAGGEQQGK